LDEGHSFSVALEKKADAIALIRSFDYGGQLSGEFGSRKLPSHDSLLDGKGCSLSTELILSAWTLG
jgi:hypothetical protein